MLIPMAYVHIPSCECKRMIDTLRMVIVLRIDNTVSNNFILVDEGVVVDAVECLIR